MKQKLTILSFLICLFFGFLIFFTNPQKVKASSLSVTGHAKIMNTDNSYLDFTDYNSAVNIDDGTGYFSGYAFLEDIGWVAFGTTDNSLGPVEINLSNGAISGKAKVLNTDAYLDFTNYNSNVEVNLDTGAFSGYVWSKDVGWIDFTDTGVSTTPLSGISIDIVDDTFTTIANPTIDMSATSFSSNCQTVTGTLGTASKQIYIDNRPTGVQNGWDVTLAAANVAIGWTSSSSSYDFNNSSGSGCTSGQMTIDASSATLDYGQDETTDIVTGILKGSSTAFNQGVVDSITLLSGDSSSDESGDWTIQGINISQKIPAQQAVGNYTLQMVISVIAK